MQVYIFPSEIIAHIASFSSNPFPLAATCKAYRTAILERLNAVLERVWRTCQAEFQDRLSTNTRLSPYEGLCFLARSQNDEFLFLDENNTSLLARIRHACLHRGLLESFQRVEEHIRDVNFLEFFDRLPRAWSFVFAPWSFFKSVHERAEACRAFLGTHVSYCREQKELSFIGVKMTQIPRELVLFPNVTTLDFFGSSLRFLPCDALKHLQHVSLIDLSFNTLTRIGHVVFPRNGAVFIGGNDVSERDIESLKQRVVIHLWIRHEHRSVPNRGVRSSCIASVRR